MKANVQLFLILVILVMFPALTVFGETLPGAQYAWGNWQMKDGRLYQLDVKTGLAKMNLKVPQSGTMLYEFNVRYEGGAVEDRHGGFGIHVFVDKPHPGKAWGNGHSYLLWLNYDENATTVTKGFSAQLYKSVSHSRMDLIADIDLNRYAYVLTVENLRVIVPVKIVINGNTGDVKIYDPVDPTWVYVFNLGNTAPLKGDYLALRSNSMAVSFGR
ncbi:MAG: hypothetical protein AB1798_06820 [Spirochaetota bacterium]